MSDANIVDPILQDGHLMSSDMVQVLVLLRGVGIC